MNGLGAAFGAQLIENAAAVRFHRILTDAEFFSDFAVAQALGDEFEDFDFAAGDSRMFAPGRRIYGTGFSESQAEPDSERGEDGGDESAVDFDGVVDDQKSVLGPLEEGDQDAAD